MYGLLSLLGKKLNPHLKEPISQLLRSHHDLVDNSW